MEFDDSFKTSTKIDFNFRNILFIRKYRLLILQGLRIFITFAPSSSSNLAMMHVTQAK